MNAQNKNNRSGSCSLTYSVTLRHGEPLRRFLRDRAMTTKTMRFAKTSRVDSFQKAFDAWLELMWIANDLPELNHGTAWQELVIAPLRVIYHYHHIPGVSCSFNDFRNEAFRTECPHACADLLFDEDRLSAKVVRGMACKLQSGEITLDWLLTNAGPQLHRVACLIGREARLNETTVYWWLVNHSGNLHEIVESMSE
jgi:hypothetical protein